MLRLYRSMRRSLDQDDNPHGVNDRCIQRKLLLRKNVEIGTIWG